MRDSSDSPVPAIPVRKPGIDDLSDLGRLAVSGGDSGLAEGAVSGNAGLAQDALLAGIEARLTEEVRRLVGSLDQFGRRTQLIGELLPDSSNFGKSVTSLLALLGFQLAYALGKGLDTPLLLDDGAEYLRKLCLTSDELFREVSLDGRRYMAVARIEDDLAELKDAAGRGKEC